MTSKTLKKLILANFAIIVCVGLVIFIKGSGVKKVTTPSNGGIVTENKEKKVENNSDEEDDSETDTPASTGTAATSSTVPSTTTTAPSSPAIDTRCIVTVSGNRYDVTVYKTQHSGGDIFKCGTDMTSAFYSQHGAGKLNQMSKYLVK